MEKILKRLQQLGLNGDEIADNLYWDAKELDEDSFSLWVAENDSKLRKVLNVDALLTDADKEDKAFLKEYTDIRNNGLSIFKGDKKLDPKGKPMKTLDDFMGALGVGNGEYKDDDRAAFSNPQNPKYWKNMPEEDRTLAALSLGYNDAEEMGADIDRVANGFQLQNQVEGYGPNNELQPVSWAISALKGFATPRVKEAQMAGRDVTWQDVAGDMAELGLNFIPGVGIVGKGGKVIAKIPGASKVANTAAGSMLGQGAAMVADQVAVPGLTQAIDANILYNPNVLGDETSGLNPRSEFDLGKMAAQSGAIAGAKGTVKGAAMVGKNMLEQGMGSKAGKSAFRQGFDMFESIGEKTDDLIKRRQAMLDRKAELAKLRENVNLPGDRDVVTSGVSTDDLINAENYRILTSEAERLANSEKARQASRTSVSGEEAAKILDNTAYKQKPVWNGYQFVLMGDPMLEKRVNAGIAADVSTPSSAGYVYRQANENTPYKDLLVMNDGRVVPKEYVTREGELQYPGADYTFKADAQLSPLKFQYDDGINNLIEKNSIKEPVDFNPAINHRNEVSRNPAVLKQIENDDLLRRKLDPSKTAFKENARDVLANIGFNALAREGVVGNVGDFDKKREQALWNKMMIKMRPLTANSKLPIEVRKKNADAVMNVMQYGLEGLPTELFQQNPKVYHIIADNLGVKGWRHPSEESNPQPTTSYSSAF